VSYVENFNITLALHGKTSNKKDYTK